MNMVGAQLQVMEWWS